MMKSCRQTPVSRLTGLRTSPYISASYQRSCNSARATRKDPTTGGYDKIKVDEGK
ncbi:MAG: hypothetical protein ISR77_22435 [Pirellulaceae bacterium]|nr:hypothetical protein [Pirellulaceae bacterium]